MLPGCCHYFFLSPFLHLFCLLFFFCACVRVLDMSILAIYCFMIFFCPARVTATACRDRDVTAICTMNICAEEDARAQAAFFDTVYSFARGEQPSATSRCASTQRL